MSITWRINAHNVTGSNEALRSITLWSDTARAVSYASYYVVKVGVADGAKVDWVGTWDGSANTLSARTSLELAGYGSDDRDDLLQQGAALLVEVERVGSPSPSAAGLTVEFHLERVGGNSERPAPLFQTAGYIPDTRTRAAVDGLQGQLNDSGVTRWSVAVPLSDPAVEILDAEGSPEPQYDNNNSTFTPTSSTYVDLEEVTVTVPNGQTHRIVLIGGASMLPDAAGAVDGIVRIYNVTDSVAGAPTVAASHSTAAGYQASVSVGWMETISGPATKVYRLQGNKNSGAVNPSYYANWLVAMPFPA